MAKRTESRRMNVDRVESNSHGDKHELILTQYRDPEANRRVVLELYRFTAEDIAKACIKMLEAERKHYVQHVRYLVNAKQIIANRATWED